MDLFDKIKSYTKVSEAREMGVYPYFLPLQNSEGTTAIFEGHEVIMIGSNNYLGLTTHPHVKQGAMDAIAKYGTSCTGSRFLNGTLELHIELEHRLARFMGSRGALTFPTGYQTNVGTITALVGKGDYVIIDKEDHASIVDACLMCRGEMRRFSHNDISSLEIMLSRIPEEAGKLVVVDGVYSMGGDIAPLPEIVPSARNTARGSWSMTRIASASLAMDAVRRRTSACKMMWTSQWGRSARVLRPLVDTFRVKRMFWITFSTMRAP